MAFYVAHLYNEEILSMKVAFVKDENGSIWLNYASDIRVRENTVAKLALNDHINTRNATKAIAHEHADGTHTHDHSDHEHDEMVHNDDNISRIV